MTIGEKQCEAAKLLKVAMVRLQGETLESKEQMQELWRSIVFANILLNELSDELPSKKVNFIKG